MKHKKPFWLFLIFAVAAIVGWMLSSARVEQFVNPGEIREAQGTLRSEMKDLRAIMESRKLRAINDKGSLADGLYKLNASFYGEGGSSIDVMGPRDIPPAPTTPVIAAAPAPAPAISSLFIGAFTVSVTSFNYTSDTIKKYMTVYKDITVKELPSEGGAKLTYPDTRVLLYVPNGYDHKSKILNFINSGGNVVFAAYFWSFTNTGIDTQKFTSLKFSGSTTYAYSMPIKIERSHPITDGLKNGDTIEISPKVEIKFNATTAFNPDDVIVSYKDYPIVAVKTLGSSRLVSLNLWLEKEFNDVGQKLVQNCILWAAGRI